jgi:release factor glutamine methyltransferase
MDIYQPAEDSYLLQKQVKKYAFGRVLDLGTGSGIQALTAAKSKNVREIVAVDINPDAIKELKEKFEKNKIPLKKIIFKESDLFTTVKDKFDTIIFNPPYLPEDKIGKETIQDPALYGGKHGWELSELFFNEVNHFLVANGKILFLFSSLTNKEKIEEIIVNNLLEFKELAKEKLPMFETLYAYLVEKSQLLRDLEKMNIAGIKYFTHGKRGNIFIAQLDQSKFIKSHFAKKKIIKVGIKIKRKESQAIERIENEARWLKILNKEGIGPNLLFSGDKYLVYRFIEGEFILDWIKDKDNNKKMINKVLIEMLQQCFILDKLKVNKEEMHHPLKHIIVDKFNHPTLLDFERCSKTDKPKNVTQFVEFICRMKKELVNKNITINVAELRKLAKEYKTNINQKNLEMIINSLNS